MSMTLYIAQKLTEAGMRDLRAAGAAGSGKRLARLSSRPARTAAGARHGVPGEKT